MSTSKHQLIQYEIDSKFDNSADPVTKNPFAIGDNVVVCQDKNSLISLRSLKANEYQCPFCLKKLDANLSIVGPAKLEEDSKKVHSSKPSPYPDNRRENQFSRTWVVLIGAFCLLASIGAIVVARSLQTISRPGSGDNSAQSLKPSSVATHTYEEVPTSVPTQLPVVESNHNSWIIYAFGQDQVGGSESTTGRDLYLINWKNGEKRQLTSGNAGNNFPSFSSDGNKVVYTGCRPDCQLYVLDINTREEVQLSGISVKAMAPRWCPVKPWIVFEARQSNRQISVWMFDLSDNKITTLTKGPADSRPIWSPDCSKVLFGRATADTDGNGYVSTNDRLDMYIYDLANRTTDILLKTPDADEFGFAWSPNSNLIAFTRVSQDTDHNGQITLDDQSDLFLYNIDTKQETNLTNGSYSAFSPSFSFDGSLIVFTSYEGYGSQIVVYSLPDETFVPVTESGSYYHPSWEP